ncbi:hypothetical protein [Flagellimonas marina]|uniref:Uncharacterized protein n=1 Tax=Flagellimonas marina TaxID=1775168 RepID=A0ABV8PHH9_9FLAO
MEIQNELQFLEDLNKVEEGYIPLKWGSNTPGTEWMIPTIEKEIISSLDSFEVGGVLMVNELELKSYIKQTPYLAIQ